MPLDNSNYISEMNIANPVGNIDLVSQMDDFLREIKKTVKQSFPNISKQARINSDELNNLKDYLVRSGTNWSIQNGGIFNVTALDNDTAVEPRLYNDQRYLTHYNALNDLNDKSEAVNTLMSNLNGGSAGYASMRTIVCNMVYPVGTIYYNSIQGNNPRDFFGVGTWIAWSQGRVIVGVGVGTDTRGEARGFSNQSTGGEFNHVLSEYEMPSHNHGNGLRMPNNGREAQVQGDWGPATTGKAWSLGGNNYSMPQSSTSWTGGSQAHNNMQPYTSAFCWIRTA